MKTTPILKSSATSLSDYLEDTKEALRENYTENRLESLKSMLKAKRNRPLTECEREKKQQAKEAKRQAWMEKEERMQGLLDLVKEEGETTLEIGIEL